MSLLRKLRKGIKREVAQFVYFDEDNNKEIKLFTFYNDLKTIHLMKDINTSDVQRDAEGNTTTTLVAIEKMFNAIKQYILDNMNIEDFQKVIRENYNSNEEKQILEVAQEILDSVGKPNATKEQLWRTAFEQMLSFDIQDENDFTTKVYYEVFEKINSNFDDEAEEPAKKKKTTKKKK